MSQIDGRSKADSRTRKSQKNAEIAEEFIQMISSAFSARFLRTLRSGVSSRWHDTEAS
jgi:hypothetical protein